jgi:hypothetical protein
MIPRHDEPPARDMLAAMHDRLQAERGLRARLRELPTPLRVLLAALVLALVALVVAVVTLRGDFGAYPQVRFWASLVVPAGLSLALLLALFRPLSRRPLGPVRRWGLALAALLVPLAIAVLPPAHDLVHAHPESFADAGGQFWPRAIGCLVFGCASALPLLALALALDRGPGLRRDRLLIAGGLGGLAGTIALQLHCPLVSIDHLVAGHAAVPLALIALIAGRRIFSRSM